MARRSLPQMVDARISTSTWTGPGSGTGTWRSSTRRPPGRKAPSIVAAIRRSSRPISADAVARRAFAARNPHGLGVAEQHLVDELHALHRRVIHVADLVQPRAEAATRPDVVLAQPRLDRPEARITGDGRNGVAHVRGAPPGG